MTVVALTPSERAARDAWRGGAVRGPFHGVCDGCGRHRDEADRPLMVARQRGSRRFLCLTCFEGGAAS